MDMLKADHDEMSEDRISNLKELVTVFKRSEGYYEGNTKQKVQQLLDQIALYTSLDKSSYDEAIILSTIHQVKGLEFKVVFMVVMEEGIFPSDFSLVDPRELEEESDNLILDYSIPFELFGNTGGKFKTGFYAQNINRDFAEKRFEYEIGPRSFTDFADDINGFFSYMGIVDSSQIGTRTRYTFGNLIDDDTNQKNQYTKRLPRECH